MVDPVTLVGALAGIFGIAGFTYQVYRKRQEVKELQQEKHAVLEAKEELEDEKEDLKTQRDEYQETIQATRSIIRDIQGAIKNGEVDQSRMAEILDELEETILPVDERLLSKVDRLGDQLTNLTSKHDNDDDQEDW